MLRLQTKRLYKFDLRKENIAATIIKLLPRLIEIHVLAKNCSPINALVIESDFTVGHIVVHNHLARSNDDHLADLLWIQPTHVNVGDNLGWILQVEEDNVIDPILNKRHPLPEHRRRFHVAQPILNDADVVRAEVPKGIDIRPDPSEIKSLAINITDFAKIAVIDQT